MDTKKEITIYDIAAHLKLSASTISRGLTDHPAIRKETKKRIHNAAREMGYQHNTFASNLRKKRTNTIGVIIPRLNSYFVSTVIAGMEKVVNDAGYNLIISQSQEAVNKEKKSVDTMFNSRTDGLLVSLSYETQNLDHFDTIFKKRIPVVFFDRVFEHPDCISVVIDNYKAGYEATKHLISQGCTKIVHIGGTLDRNVYADRFKGYKKALKESGLMFSDDLFIMSTLSDEAGVECIDKLLAMNPRLDGIFTSNDTSAVAIICELKKAGISVPEDVAVVGFNNDPISKVIEPNLTTVNYPGEEMGEIAATTLINTLKDDRDNQFTTIILKHELKIRASSLRKKN